MLGNDPGFPETDDFMGLYYLSKLLCTYQFGNEMWHIFVVVQQYGPTNLKRVIGLTITNNFMEWNEHW